MPLDSRFQKILWEYDLLTLDLESDIVGERVFSFSDRDLSSYWIEKVGKQKAKEIFLKNINQLDKKSLNYWGVIFGVETKELFNSKKTMYDKLNKAVFSRNIG